MGRPQLPLIQIKSRPSQSNFLQLYGLLVQKEGGGAFHATSTVITIQPVLVRANGRNGTVFISVEKTELGTRVIPAVGQSLLRQPKKFCFFFNFHPFFETRGLAALCGMSCMERGMCSAGYSPSLAHRTYIVHVWNAIYESSIFQGACLRRGILICTTHA